MKVFIVLFLAIAAARAFDLGAKSKLIDIAPVVPFFEPESRITNGKPAETGQFPYQVRLRIALTPTSGALGGGSLIAREWIVTAAHCVDGNPSSVTAYVGSISRPGGTAYTALQIFIHSGWNPNTLANDIALLRVPPVTLGANVNTVPLPPISSSSSYLNDVVVASGWGKTSDSESPASTLQYAYLRVVANSVCANVYGTSVIKPSHLCVATPNGTSTCGGDSGGPLCRTKNGVLIGITAIGAAAGCTKGYPVAFTRITSYRSWINGITGV